MPEPGTKEDARHYDAHSADGGAAQGDPLVDLATEERILSTALVLGVIPDDMRAVQPKHFADDGYGDTYAAILASNQSTGRVNLDEVVDRLPHSGCSDDGTAFQRMGGADKLACLFDSHRFLTPATAACSYYVEKLIDKFNRRQLFETGELIKASALNGKAPADTAKDGISRLEVLAKPPDEGQQEMRYDQMKRKFTGLRAPTIWGIARAGEVVNIIAPPKTGKSWLVLFLALCFATGKMFLGLFKTERGKVLLIDNELHVETLTDRIAKVAAAMGLDDSDYVDYLGVRCLRGLLRDMAQICAMLLREYKPGELRAVIIDSMYKAYPEWCDENSNPDMTRIYTMLDNVALELGCTIFIVHHASKGNQSEKSVTDTGAGAGAQSRSPDTHLVIRQHEVEDVFVVEGVVRSWAPLEPICIRREFPLWVPVEGLDPTQLKRPARRAAARKDRTEGKAETDRPVWTVDKYAAEIVGDKPSTEGSIIDRAMAAGFSMNKAKEFLKCARGKGVVHTWKFGARTANQYATQTQPELPKAPETTPDNPTTEPASV